MVLPMFISLFHKNISIGIILGSQSQDALLQKVFYDVTVAHTIGAWFNNI